MRFAFYGRVSTVEYQDAESSLGWQRDSARDVIVGRGRIVAEFFDVGYSRTVPWAKRPQAARLLEAVTDPDRGFDAIIVGESERAFTGTQLLRLAPVLVAHAVQVWLPELDGPVDLADPAHRALVMQPPRLQRRTPTTDREDRERVVYVREDELLDDLAAMLSRESGRAPTSEEVPALLRERKTTVVCSHTRQALRHADTDSGS